MTSTTQFARFAPGIDEPPATEGQTLNPIFDPSRGPGGVYARTLQGATPKYAINDGIEREPGQAKTLARMYIKTSNLNALKNSITDPQVKNQLILQPSLHWVDKSNFCSVFLLAAGWN